MKVFMKSITLSFLLIIGLVIIPKESEASSIAYAVPLHDHVVIYDNRSGLVPIAEMKLNEPLMIYSDYGANWWKIKFGSGYGYISKKDVYRSTTWTTLNINTYYKNSNLTVLTNVDTEVYDNSSGKLVPIAKIKAGLKYPVIADTGNFWKVDVGGRIGYIPKFKTSVDVPNRQSEPSKPKRPNEGNKVSSIAYAVPLRIML